MTIPVDVWQKIKELGKERHSEFGAGVRAVLYLLLPTFKTGDFVVTTNSRSDGAYVGEEPHQTIWIAVDADPMTFTAIELAHNRGGEWQFTERRLHPCHPYLDGDQPPRLASAYKLAFLRNGKE